MAQRFRVQTSRRRDEQVYCGLHVFATHSRKPTAGWAWVAAVFYRLGEDGPEEIETFSCVRGNTPVDVTQQRWLERHEEFNTQFNRAKAEKYGEKYRQKQHLDIEEIVFGHELGRLIRKYDAVLVAKRIQPILPVVSHALEKAGADSRDVDNFLQDMPDALDIKLMQDMLRQQGVETVIEEEPSVNVIEAAQDVAHLHFSITQVFDSLAKRQ